MRWHLRSLRKPTGGVLKEYRGKKKFQQGGNPILTKLGEEKMRAEKVVSGNVKRRLFNSKKVVVSMGGGRSQVTQIENVLETPDNPNYVRRRIITKGTLVKTKLGNARITSRPGQQGTLQAVIVK